MFPSDRELIQIVDAAMAEAARRSGPWLVCRPGCTQCCQGPFAVAAQDARRLQRALAELEESDAGRARRVRERAEKYVSRLGTRSVDEILAGDRFDDEPCPALDPMTGTCDLYDGRPMLCRIFGPPVQLGSGSLGVCELCFAGASDAEIAACEVRLDAAMLGLEDARDETLVAFALLG